MHNVRLGMWFGVTLLVFGVLALLFWDFIRETIVVPIYYFFWIIDITIKVVPESIYLAVLILVGFALSLNALRDLQLRRPYRQQTGTPQATSTRYTIWARLYKNLYARSILSNHFSSETRKLLLNLLAYQEGVTTDEIEVRVKNDTLALPSAVKTLLEHKAIRLNQPEYNANHNWLQRWLNPPQPALDSAETDPQVAEIVAFIEHRLEITHDEPRL